MSPNRKNRQRISTRRNPTNSRDLASLPVDRANGGGRADVRGARVTCFLSPGAASGGHDGEGPRLATLALGASQLFLGRVLSLKRHPRLPRISQHKVPAMRNSRRSRNVIKPLRLVDPKRLAPITNDRRLLPSAQNALVATNADPVKHRPLLDRNASVRRNMNNRVPPPKAVRGCRLSRLFSAGVELAPGA